MCPTGIAACGGVRSIVAVVVGAPTGSAGNTIRCFAAASKAVAAQQVAAGDDYRWPRWIHHRFVLRVAADRYDLHPLVQQYAAERLLEAEAVAARHAAFYADFVQQREAALKGADQAAALEIIDRELGNVRAMWEWAIGMPDLAALRRSMDSLVTFSGLTVGFTTARQPSERAAAYGGREINRFGADRPDRMARTPRSIGHWPELLAGAGAPV